MGDSNSGKEALPSYPGDDHKVLGCGVSFDDL
jgi:hypothetical protein